MFLKYTNNIAKNNLYFFKSNAKNVLDIPVI